MDCLSHECLTESIFFDLVDGVLQKAGRAPLTPDGPQRSIISVQPTDRVLQIVAGPGSGKTEMLVWRILFTILLCKVESHRILVTTFTRKAATELSIRIVERADALLEEARLRGITISDPHVHDIRIGTLHSLCDSLLSEYDNEYMSSGTQLIDEFEARIRLSRAASLPNVLRNRWVNIINNVQEMQPLISLFKAPWEGTNWPSSNMERIELLERILAHQTETWYPRCGSDQMKNGVEVLFGIDGLTENLSRLQEKWEQHLEEQSLIDFTTIQKRFYERQEIIFDSLDHVFVDEFQDTNPIQFAIHTKWLMSSHIKLTVVGDDDQSIYRFRGSDIQCFIGLEKQCDILGVSYRIEKLEENMRSTRNIVEFCQAYKNITVLRDTSMPKHVYATPKALTGEPVRLLQGHWQLLCDYVGSEITGFQRDIVDPTAPESFAFLMFSTSEKGDSKALHLRNTLQNYGLRVYNPRNKTAAEKGSPVYELMGLISYLIDPVTKAPAGRNGRNVEVWATHNENDKVAFAKTAPPPFRISNAYSKIQKGLLKMDGGSVDNPSAGIRPLTQYLDQIRANLVKACQSHDKRPRLTLAGLVSRLLSFDRYRDVGFSRELVRESLFTSLLEASIAPTRMTKQSLDSPLELTVNSEGKYVWPDRFWSLLNTMGSLLDSTNLDDPEMESFSDGAVQLLTFHQSKGLEFDHVYVALTGRDVQVNNVLQTMVFSGKTPKYEITADGTPITNVQEVIQLATADREREIYVALTRAKKRLTILSVPDDSTALGRLNPGLQSLFSGVSDVQIEGWAGLTERRYPIE